MRSLKKIICVFLSVLIVCAGTATVAFANDSHTEHDICHPNPSVGTTGKFNAMTFDVNGYPINLDDPFGSDQFGDSFSIGRKLNELNYDVIAIQDNFNYDIYLRAYMSGYENDLDTNGNVVARHQSVHSGGVPNGDGLDVFSRYHLYNEARVTWEKSAGFVGSGNDNLSYKGIEVTTIELAKSYYLDIYNIHADEGTDEKSIAARQAQFTQLANYIKKHSVYDESTGTYDHAVLVTGDFSANIHTENNGKTADKLVTNLLEAAHLNDAWAVTTIDYITEDAGTYEAYYDYAARTNMTQEDSFGHYDSGERFCYASGNGIKISCTGFSYKILHDTAGKQLSDHSAALADFSWEIIERVNDIGHNHDDENVAQDQGFLFKFLNYIASIFRAIGKFFQDYENWFNVG